MSIPDVCICHLPIARITQSGQWCATSAFSQHPRRGVVVTWAVDLELRESFEHKSGDKVGTLGTLGHVRSEPKNPEIGT